MKNLITSEANAQHQLATDIRSLNLFIEKQKSLLSTINELKSTQEGGKALLTLVISEDGLERIEAFRELMKIMPALTDIISNGETIESLPMYHIPISTEGVPEAVPDDSINILTKKSKQNVDFETLKYIQSEVRALTIDEDNHIAITPVIGDITPVIDDNGSD